ncbi:Peroxidase [Halotydeus destructor]|nr:Peroxidase [Halotydeus destructor]
MPEFLPFDRNNQSDECSIPEHENQRGRLQCFVGGDVRVNEQTGLTIMHLIWLREHNRVARELKELNPQWNDEIIYQEARRIVAAEVQHITFNEWQPLIVGRRTMKEFNLMPKPTGFSYDYDPSVNPSIINSFATAAYRFHSLIQGLLKLMTNQGQVKRILMLRNLFNNPSTVYEPGNVDGYLNALTGQPTQTFDNFFTKEITEHLFQEEHLDFGMDLISLNIQRGREHGLPGYNHYRQLCGQRAASSFEELNKVMRHGAAEVFSKLYRHVDDIDLFVGLNHEKPLADGVVGPTMACILAEQSRRNKLGDRFWYENGNLLHSFSPEQLDEIRKSTMARIVCDNADTIDHMQPLAFLQSDPKWNPRTACAKLPYVNLKLWKNEPVKSAHEYK